MAANVLFYQKAGTPAVCVTTREYLRFAKESYQELTEYLKANDLSEEEAADCVMLTTAPKGTIDQVRLNGDGQPYLVPICNPFDPPEKWEPASPTRKAEEFTTAQAYAWAAQRPNRRIHITDWHMILNNPGSWQTWQLKAAPPLKSSKGEQGICSSMVVFLAPSWEFQGINPIKGDIPIVDFDPPTRESLLETLNALHPLNGNAEEVGNAVSGLTQEAAEQAAAEVLVRNNFQYDASMLWERKKQSLRDCGLELRPAILPENYGGMGRLKEFIDSELIPYSHDQQLAVRRFLWAGVMGVGKTFAAQLLAGKLGCPVAIVLSMANAKDQWQGSATRNLTPKFKTIQAIAKDSPVPVVLDEIDTLTKGHEGDSLSGDMWKILSDELQYDQSLAIYIGTLNYLDRLDPAMTTRFGTGFFFDLPNRVERQAVAEVHFRRLGCQNPEKAAEWASVATEEFSSREIAEQLVPSVARRSNRKPTQAVVDYCASKIKPASQTQAESLAKMRKAGSQLNPANDPEENAVKPVKGRRLS
jgi:hypothetical protein